MESEHDFTMQSIFEISWQQKMLKSWSLLSFHNIVVSLFAGKSLLKQAYLKWLNLLPSPGRLTQNKPNGNKVKGKNDHVLPVNYRQVFLKTLQKSIFVDSYFFSYLRFGEEPFNLQESLCEKIHFATIHLQEWLVIYQNNFEYLAEINVLVSIIIKISRECNLTNESRIHNIRKNIFQRKS